MQAMKRGPFIFAVATTLLQSAEVPSPATLRRLTKVTTTYQGNTVHVEAHTTYTPAFYGMSETMDIRDDKYEGSCPAGTQPGDTITQDGTVIRKH
jgi:hypothetical protein